MGEWLGIVKHRGTFGRKTYEGGWEEAQKRNRGGVIDRSVRERRQSGEIMRKRGGRRFPNNPTAADRGEGRLRDVSIATSPKVHN